MSHLGYRKYKMNYIKYRDGHTEEIIEYNEETMYFKTVSGQIYRLVEYIYSDEKMGLRCKKYEWQRFYHNVYGGEFYNTDEVEQAVIHRN